MFIMYSCTVKQSKLGQSPTPWEKKDETIMMVERVNRSMDDTVNYDQFRWDALI